MPITTRQIVDSDVPASIARDAEVNAAIEAHNADPFAHPGLSVGSGSGNVGTLKVVFSFGDASPKSIVAVPSGKTVLSAAIVVTTAFNGSNSSLALGDASVSDRLIQTSQVDPKAVGSYSTNPGYTYISTTAVTLAIVPGVGATQGAGFVLLQF